MSRFTLSSRLRALGVIAIVSASLLSACGSSSKSDSSSSATTASDGTLSKSDFVAQVNAVCKDLQAPVTAKQAEMKSAIAAHDPKAGIDVMTGMSKLYGDASTKIAALKPPSDGVAAQQSIISVLGKTAGLMDAQKKELSEGNQPTVPDSLSKDLADAQKPAADYGINC